VRGLRLPPLDWLKRHDVLRYLLAFCAREPPAQIFGTERPSAALFEKGLPSLLRSPSGVGHAPSGVQATGIVAKQDPDSPRTARPPFACSEYTTNSVQIFTPNNLQSNSPRPSPEIFFVRDMAGSPDTEPSQHLGLLRTFRSALACKNITTDNSETLRQIILKATNRLKSLHPQPSALPPGFPGC
jgi:hypothetical protein